MHRTGFNPCFDGSVARGSQRKAIVIVLIRVSILVLMEV